MICLVSTQSTVLILSLFGLAEFFLFYQYCRELGFSQTPDYGYLHRLLRDLIYAESFNYVMAFQWLLTEKSQMLHHSPFKPAVPVQRISISGFRISSQGLVTSVTARNSREKMGELAASHRSHHLSNAVKESTDMHQLH